MSARTKSPLFVAALLVSIVWSPPVRAQGFGLGGGPNLSDFFGEDVGDNEQKTGLDLGATMPLVRLGPLQFRAEGYYRQKGARNVSDFQSGSLSEEVEFGIDYVEVPVLARLGLPSIGQRVFGYLEGGPAFGWKIDCGMNFNSASGTSETSCDDLTGDNLQETIKDNEQGMILGGGLIIPVLSLGSISVDARYTRGLSRLAEDGDIRNRAFSVLLGYSFGLPSGFGGGGSGGMLSQRTPR